MSDEREIARKIISSGYFSNQIPGEFKSTILSNNLDKIDLSKSKLSAKGLKKWCKLIDFSIPKTEKFRRTISVPHPLHYILLAQFIEEHWGDLEKHFSKSSFSLTTPQISNEGLTTKYPMSEKVNQRIHNLSSKKFILQADINRYYPSIYTHSIPWALHTKEVAKSDHSDSYFGNRIDKLVSYSQDGQTLGIPIGPSASLVIQEIIGAAIDEDFKKEFGDDLTGFRYTDDMEFYFNSSAEAERALQILNKTLKKYELDLNSTKTRVIKIPQALEPEWQYYFKRFKFRRNNKRKLLISSQHSDIKEYFSTAFRYKSESDEKGILKFAIKVVSNVVIYKENWSIFESLLLQSILIDSSIIPTVFEVIESYGYRDYPLDYKKLTEFINVLIKDNIELKNDYEVSWALSFASKLNLSIEEDVSKLLLENDNSIINILVMILNSKNLLKGTLDFSHYKSILEEESLYDRNWLFYYECCIHSWLDKDKNDEKLKNDKFFSQLLSNDISFVDPKYSKVLEEAKESILSLCITYYKNDVKNLKIQDILLKVIKKYSFSLDKKLVDELETRLQTEINKIRMRYQEEGSIVEYNEGTQKEKVINDEVGEMEKEEKETKVATKNDDWVSNFFTTEIGKNFKISSIPIYYDY